MADSGGNVGGIGLGGVLVIVGILLALSEDLWVGVILALVGLIAFGGFAEGALVLEQSALRLSQASGKTSGSTSPGHPQVRSCPLSRFPHR